eukprot:5731738-Prymnesium_polylepis.1
MLAAHARETTDNLAATEASSVPERLVSSPTTPAYKAGMAARCSAERAPLWVAPCAAATEGGAPA